MTPTTAFLDAANLSIWEEPTPPGPVILVLDNFVDTNNVTLDGHTPDIDQGTGWTGDGAGVWSIQGNKAQGTSGTYAVIDAGESDVTVTFTVYDGNVGTQIFVIRYVDSDNHLRCEISNSTNLMKIQKRESGVSTLLATSGTVAPTAEFDVEIILDGDLVRFIALGEDLQVNTSFQQTATIHGLRGPNTTTKFKPYQITMP